METIQERLEPRGASETGFLARGEKLTEVIARDDEALRILSYTHVEIAALLEHLTSRVAISGTFPYRTQNGKQYNIKVATYRGATQRGMQECPWGDDVDIDTSPTNADIDVLTIEGERVLRIAGLLPHLVREHHFFEGSTSYRTSPEEIVAVLGEERVVGSMGKVKESLPQLKSVW